MLLMISILKSIWTFRMAWHNGRLICFEEAKNNCDSFEWQCPSLAWHGKSHFAFFEPVIFTQCACIVQAKHADLPWDTIFSAELFGSYKPFVSCSSNNLILLKKNLTIYCVSASYLRNSKVYLGGAHHLSIPPEKCAMVAAHIYDLRGAAANGMKTIYVRRPTEDNGLRDTVKSKKDGGEVDIVVDSFVELANILGKTQ